MLKLNVRTNERGVTLLELLASVTLGLIILGVCFSVMMAMFQLSESNSQRFLDNNQERQTVDAITRYVTDTPAGNGNVLVSETELRLKSTSMGTVAFRYEAIAGGTGYALRMYTLTGDIDNPDNEVLRQTLAEAMGAREVGDDPVFELAANNSQIVANLPFVYTQVGFGQKKTPKVEWRTIRSSLKRY